MAQALRESEQRFQATFNQAAVGIAHAGLDDRWLLINQRFCEIVGHRREDLLDRSARHLMYPEDLEAALENTRRLLSGELQTCSMDMRWHRDLGPDVWIRETRSLARDASGAPQYFVAVVEDISLRKQAEEQRSLGTEELARSNAELEQFAYVVSHDLQEPLRMVASYVQLLEARYKDRLDSDAHDFIAFAVDGATRMKQMIGDLLAYSRVGRKGREFVPVACEAVLGQACADLRAAMAEAAAEVSHGALPTVLGNAGQLTHLFQNLIGNAIKFRGQEPPRIHVSAELNRPGVGLLGARQRHRPGPAVRRPHLHGVSATAPPRGLPRHRNRPGHRQEDRGAPWRPNLGGIGTRKGGGFSFHGPRARP